MGEPVTWPAGIGPAGYELVTEADITWPEYDDDPVGGLERLPALPEGTIVRLKHNGREDTLRVRSCEPLGDGRYQFELEPVDD